MLKKKQSDGMGGQGSVDPFSYGQNPFGASSSSSDADPFGASSFAPQFAGNDSGSAFETHVSEGPDEDGEIRFDRGALLVSLIGAILGAITGILLIGGALGNLVPEIEHPILNKLLSIGLAVVLVGGFACLALCLYANCRPSRQTTQNRWPLLLLAVLAGLMVLGMLLQFLYGLGGTMQIQAPDDVILLIDDSGSMSLTDPQRVRVNSAKSLLDQLNYSNRAGMIFFTDRIEYERDMVALTEEARAKMADAVKALKSDGNTNISLAIDEALSMDGAEDPKRVLEIILLTDGDGGSIDFSAVAKRCSLQNTHISSIVLSHSVNMGVLNRLANATGGQILMVEDIDHLTDAYSKLAMVSTSRDLLGLRRGGVHKSPLLAVFRVLAWVIIGAAIGFSILLLLDPRPFLQVLLACAVAGLLFGVLLEIANALWWDVTLFGTNTKVIGMPMLCVTILFYRKKGEHSGGTVIRVVDVDLSNYQDSLRERERNPKYDTLRRD